MSVEIYLGNPPENIKKWIKENYKSKKNVPLHFTANEPESSVSLMVDGSSESWCEFVYSTDGMRTWNDYDGHIVYLDNCENKTVYIQAKYGDTEDNPNRNGLATYTYNEEYDYYSLHECYRFVMEGSVKAGGNIQFLLDNTGLRMDVTPYCYYEIFRDCGALTQAPELPATTLTSNCYNGMFANCTSLTEAPELPAITLADYCYKYMFRICQSLTQAPELPATELAIGCYQYMFQMCESLTKIIIAAEDNSSMIYMIDACSNLSYIEVNFTEWNNSMPWHYNNLAPTGTFVCPEGLPELYGEYYIPEGWTVVRK